MAALLKAAPPAAERRALWEAANVRVLPGPVVPAAMEAPQRKPWRMIWTPLFMILGALLSVLGQKLKTVEWDRPAADEQSL